MTVDASAGWMCSVSSKRETFLYLSLGSAGETALPFMIPQHLPSPLLLSLSHSIHHLFASINLSGSFCASSARSINRRRAIGETRKNYRCSRTSEEAVTRRRDEGACWPSNNYSLTFERAVFFFLRTRAVARVFNIKAPVAPRLQSVLVFIFDIHSVCRFHAPAEGQRVRSTEGEASLWTEQRVSTLMCHWWAVQSMNIWWRRSVDVYNWTRAKTFIWPTCKLKTQMHLNLCSNCADHVTFNQLYCYCC